jgi:peptidoglycan/xylan/chitin deacetylase (PgdA/CDA1 family)
MVEAGGWRPSPFLAASAGLHGAALVALAISPRSWGWVLGVLLVNHLLIGAAGLFPRCAWLGPNINRLPADCARRELVALTFDDGPEPDVTSAVLNLLDRAGARATFFCVGRRAEAYPELISMMRARGHGVENHSYSHPNGFALRGPRAISAQVRQAQEAIERAGGGRPRFFRAPAGIQNPWLARVLATAGLSLVSWSRRGYDTVSGDADRVVARLQRGLRAGDILLLHDGSSARDAHGRPVVLDALQGLLDEMTRKGLRSEALHAILPAPGAGEVNEVRWVER